MGASMKPDFYHEKLNVFIGLSPIVKLDHAQNIAM